LKISSGVLSDQRLKKLPPESIGPKVEPSKLKPWQAAQLAEYAMAPFSACAVKSLLRVTKRALSVLSGISSEFGLHVTRIVNKPRRHGITLRTILSAEILINVIAIKSLFLYFCQSYLTTRNLGIS
jgi:hypothetical protein